MTGVHIRMHSGVQAAGGRDSNWGSNCETTP